MSFPFIPVHPEGETPLIASKSINNPIEVHTFNGKVHVEWDPDASVRRQLYFMRPQIAWSHQNAGN